MVVMTKQFQRKSELGKQNTFVGGVKWQRTRGRSWSWSRVGIKSTRNSRWFPGESLHPFCWRKEEQRFGGAVSSKSRSLSFNRLLTQTEKWHRHAMDQWANQRRKNGTKSVHPDHKIGTISFKNSSEVASSETALLHRHLLHPRHRDSPLNQPERSDKEDKHLESHRSKG